MILKGTAKCKLKCKHRDSATHACPQVCTIQKSCLSTLWPLQERKRTTHKIHDRYFKNRPQKVLQFKHLKMKRKTFVAIWALTQFKSKCWLFYGIYLRPLGLASGHPGGFEDSVCSTPRPHGHSCLYHSSTSAH